MSATSPTRLDQELTTHASVTDSEDLPAPTDLRARLRRATQRLLDRLDEHWDDNETLANSWPTCC